MGASAVRIKPIFNHVSGASFQHIIFSNVHTLMMLTVVHLLSEPGWTEQWLGSTAILALLLEHMQLRL
jgi:hypothetical protein